MIRLLPLDHKQMISLVDTVKSSVNGPMRVSVTFFICKMVNKESKMPIFDSVKF